MLKYAIDRCKKHGIIVARQSVRRTGRTGLTFDRRGRHKRGLGFCVSKPAGRRALQKGVIPNSDVGVGRFASHGNEVLVRMMLRDVRLKERASSGKSEQSAGGILIRRFRRGTQIEDGRLGEVAYEVNAAVNLVLRLAMGRYAPQ